MLYAVKRGAASSLNNSGAQIYAYFMLSHCRSPRLMCTLRRPQQKDMKEKLERIIIFIGGCRVALVDSHLQWWSRQERNEPQKKSTRTSSEEDFFFFSLLLSNICRRCYNVCCVCVKKPSALSFTSLPEFWGWNRLRVWVFVRVNFYGAFLWHWYFYCRQQHIFIFSTS